MRRTSKRSFIGVGAAMLMLAANVVVAKPHDGRGRGEGRGGTEPGPRHGGGRPADASGGRPDGRGGSTRGQGGSVCDPVVAAAVDAVVATACPCDGLDDGSAGTTPWKSRGRYVRCVARAVRDELRLSGLKRRCMRDVVACASRSNCGRADGVTCVVTASDTCVGAACANRPDEPCATDADCATRACGITTAARCAALGGTAGTGSCCFASPSGAFVEGS